MRQDLEMDKVNFPAPHCTSAPIFSFHSSPLGYQIHMPVADPVIARYGIFGASHGHDGLHFATNKT